MIEAMKDLIECVNAAIKAGDWKIDGACDPTMALERACQAIATEESSATQEPVALKTGECWPEEVMQQWDYWRKEIANGHKGSAPRDWFEGLSELRLIDTHPQPKAEQEPKREPLTEFEKAELINKHTVWSVTLKRWALKDFALIEAVEAAHGIKGEA